MMHLFSQEHISNEDSYIYLAAIQGLATLSDSYPDDVIMHLTNELVKMTTSESDIQVKLKVGEILVKVSRNLGIMYFLSFEFHSTFVPAFIPMERMVVITPVH